MTRLVIVLSLALLASACSAGEKRASLDDAKAVKTDTVTLAKSYRFDPEVITVPAGTTVTWKSEDNFTHDLKFSEGPDTKRHELGKGDDVKITFDEPGTYDYECTLHPRDMRGRVVVT
jgi:plastocyanin